MLDVKADVAVFSSMVVLAVESRGVCIRGVGQVQGDDSGIQMFRRQGERLPTRHRSSGITGTLSDAQADVH